MRTCVLAGLLAAWSAVGCGGAPQDDEKPGTPSFPDENELNAVAQALVDAHNVVRANVSPPASPPLEPLVWDNDIADTAQDWSNRCVFQHSSNNLGENVAFFSGDAATAQDIVDAWSSEASDYSYAGNSCSGVCGHYTQIVWRNSVRLGCGVSDCNIQGSSGRMWTCNYDPPGNFNGERPY